MEIGKSLCLLFFVLFLTNFFWSKFQEFGIFGIEVIE